MQSVILLGGGKIGRMIAQFLVDSESVDLVVADADSDALQRIQAATGVATMNIDVRDATQLDQALTGRDAVVSALSYHLNPAVAESALRTGASS